MAIEIFIESDSSPDEIEKAFQAIAFGYQTAIVNYTRKQRILSIADLARKAGCQYPDIVEKFIYTTSVSLLLL